MSIFRSGRILLLLALLGGGILSVAAAQPGEWQKKPLSRGVVIETVGNGPARVVDGDERLLSRPACPASTFKLIIAWAGLETGVLRADTRVECREERIASGIYRLDLHNALLRSSNRYFEVIAGRIGEARLTEYVQKSGLVNGTVPKDWLKHGTNAAVWGGDLLVAPAQAHELMGRIAAGTLASPATNEILVSAIEWPCDVDGMRVFGKSGTMRHAAWFTGFAREKNGQTRTVTVFLRGGLSRKPEAAGRFFERFGLKPPSLPPLGDVDK